MFFYHSNIGKEIVGVVEIIKTAFLDKTDKEGKFVAVKVKFKEKFKKEKDFHDLGIGVGSPYKKWFDEVDLLSNNPNGKLLLKYGVLPGELKTLGTEYLQSQGKETEYTTFINSEIKRNFKD